MWDHEERINNYLNPKNNNTVQTNFENNKINYISSNKRSDHRNNFHNKQKQYK